MEYKISEEQILELNNTSSGKTQGLLKEWFPDVFKPKFEIGSWYRHNLNNNKTVLVCYQGGKKGYGFNFYGNWDVSNIWSFESDPEKWELVTVDKVHDKMIEYFNNNYDENGFISLNTNTICGKMVYGISYEMISDTLSVNNEICYQKGKWAEKYVPIVELTIDEIAERFGVSASQIKIKK